MRAFFFIVLAAALLGLAGAAGAARAGAVTLDRARELHRAGRLEAAAAAYRAVVEDAELDPPSRAIANNNLCMVLDALGDLAVADTTCRTALELRRGLGDRGRLARTLNNHGLVLQHLGRYGEAEERFSEALAINRDLEAPLAQAINLANLGAAATLSGRFQEALDRHRAVSELARRHAGQPWAAEQLRIAQLNRGVVLERLGAYREALEVYRALLEGNTGLGGEEEASLLVNSGVIYRNLGDPVQAVERFEAAAAVYDRLGDRSGLAHVELNIGIARHLNLGDAVGAEASYRRALEWVERSGNRGLEIEVLGFLGRLLLSGNRVDEARSRFEEGLALARESGSAEGEWSALAGLGETERAQGNLEGALARFESAIALIEERRAKVVRPEHRASFLAAKRSVYSGALETLGALDRRESGAYAGRALELAQQAKSRDLLDALGLRLTSREPLAAPMKPLGAAELKRRLGEDLLVEYFVTDAELLIWWTEAGAVRFASLGDPQPILDAAQVVHRALSIGSNPPQDLVDRLSAQLLGPWIGALDSLAANAGNLWIAPDRRLRYLPFEILSVPGEASEGPEVGRPLRLIERARISYLPSAWALPDASRPSRSSELEVGFLGFGGVDVSRGSDYPRWVARLALEPLPEARHELERAARRIGGERRIFQGPEATEASFKANAGRGSKVMHFATHTALAGRPGEETAILLTPGGSDDGMLSPAEIAGLSVDSILVVLAACTTALGGEQDGRALTTLTGAFLAAGSQAVLATLWPVGDQPTAVFMDQFYYQLSRGLVPAEALRRTKLRFMAEELWSNPALWSGYVLVGSAPAIVARGVSWVWLGALALAAVIGLTLRRAKAPQKTKSRR